jgi:oligopeptide/dipeptide ABC transporter ATP-binding protein
MTRDILLETKDIKKYFPVKKKWFTRGPRKTVKAVDGISLQIFRGEALGLIGESGCGKSTFSRVVMHLIPPTEGQVFYNGKPVTGKDIMEFRRRVQMVFQDPYSSLDPRMNVRDIIEEPLRVHTNLSAEEKLAVVKKVLEQIELPAETLEKYPHEFSGGQRQRIGIARVLVTDPELLVCDEPVSALDVSIQASILNLFKQMQRERGLSYLFISHDLSVVKHLCDRIAVMYLGRIVELAEKKELFANTLHPYTQALMSAIPAIRAANRGKKIRLQGEPPSPIDPPSGCAFHVRCPYAEKICAEQVPPLRDMGGGHMAACHFCGKEGKMCSSSQ